MVKSCGGQCAAVANGIKTNVGIGQNGSDEDKAGHGADDYGIPECSGRGNQCLTHGVSRLCCRSNDGSGTHPRFIGEKAASNPITHGHHDGGSNETSPCRFRIKGTLANENHSVEEKCAIDNQDDDTTQYVENGHKGN